MFCLPFSLFRIGVFFLREDVSLSFVTLLSNLDEYFLTTTGSTFRKLGMHVAESSLSCDLLIQFLKKKIFVKV